MPNSAGEMHLGDHYNHYSVHQDYVRDLEDQNAFGNNPSTLLCRGQFTIIFGTRFTPLFK